MERGRLLVDLALGGPSTTTHQLYAICKIIERNEFILIPNNDLSQDQNSDLFILKYEEIEYHAIRVLTGDKSTMEKNIKNLKDYERLQNNYKTNFVNSNSIALQTELLTRTIGIQTDVLLEEDAEGGKKWFSYFRDVVDAPNGGGIGPTDSELTCHVQVFSKKKKFFCIFCKMRRSSLPRHLVLKHPEEERVCEFSTLPNKDPKRLRIVADIRSEGIIEESLTQGIAVQARKGLNLEDCLPCPRCKVFFKKNTLNRHFKRCSGEKKAPKTLIKVATAHTKKDEIPTTLSLELREEVLPGMAIDNITEIIYDDPVILEYGNMLALRHSSDIKKQKNMIRSKLRNVAKFKKIFLGKDSAVRTLDDIFRIDKWQCFVESAREFGRLDRSSATKDSSPNNVLNIGMAMVNIARDFKASCSVDEDGRQKRKTVQAWIELYERKFNSTIGRQAKKIHEKRSWESKKLLPIAEDVMKLTNYLKREMKESIVLVKNKFSMEAFDKLNQSVMLQLLTFNRKRIGEVQNILVDDFKRKEMLNKESDIYNSLREYEKMLAGRFYHVNVKGKLHRGVPLLISEELSSAADLIIENRGKAGIDRENRFLFAKGKTGYYNASTAMSIAALECGAKYPENLTSTGLRKHVATAAQALNLTESDLRKLSGFLGHTVQTHLEHYRQPSEAVHTAQVSRLLLALDTCGNLNEFKGKKIEEIDIDIPIETTLTTLNEPKQRTPDKAFIPVLFDQPSTSFVEPCTSITEATLNTIPSPIKKRKVHMTPTKSKTSPLKKISPIISPPKRRVRQKWTTSERKVMLKAFGECLKTEKLPSFRECYEVKKNNPELISRKVPIMKAWVFNEINRRRRDRKEDTNSEDTDNNL